MAKKESYRNVRTAKYTQVSNSFLNDKEGSLQAKGLLSILLSNSDDWEIHMSEIISRSKNGRDAHYATINELIKLGYFARISVIGADNRFEEMIYLFSDIKNDVEEEINRIKNWAKEVDKKLTIEFRGVKEPFPKNKKSSEPLIILRLLEIRIRETRIRKVRTIIILRVKILIIKILNLIIIIKIILMMISDLSHKWEKVRLIITKTLLI